MRQKKNPTSKNLSPKPYITSGMYRLGRFPHLGKLSLSFIIIVGIYICILMSYANFSKLQKFSPEWVSAFSIPHRVYDFRF